MADGVGEIYHVPKKIGAKIQQDRKNSLLDCELNQAKIFSKDCPNLPYFKQITYWLH